MDDPNLVFAFVVAKHSSLMASLSMVAALVPPSGYDFTLTAADLWTSVLWVSALLGINAFFVAVEFSLVSVRRSRMAQLEAEGNPQASLVRKAQEHLERSLSTPQLGITFSSLALGWIGALQVSRVMGVGIRTLPFYPTLEALFPLSGAPGELAFQLAIPLTFGLITYLQIVVGELIPKTVAIVYAESVALWLAQASTWVSRFLLPLVELPRFTSRLLLQWFKVPIPDSATLYNTITSEELELLIASSGESGSIEAEERELLRNVFEFGETVASEVMVPRTSIDAVSETATIQDVLTELSTSGHSLYPVIGESLDDIRGLVYLKELVAELGQGRVELNSSINPFIRPAIFEHENKLIAELLQEMQQHHAPMVVVVDEFGGTAGLVTIENIVEEIVGNISDASELSEQIPDIEKINDHEVIIQAQMDVDEVNDHLTDLHLDLPLLDDYQTLGGFVIYHLQKIPKVGETLHFRNLEFKVIKAEGPRLDRIQLKILPLATTAPAIQEGSQP